MLLTELESQVAADSGWKKSSFSAANGFCLEAKKHGVSIFLRDSKYRRNPRNDRALEPVIELTEGDWDLFVRSLSQGDTPPNDALAISYDKAGGARLTSRADGTNLTLTAAEFSAFLRGIEVGELNSRQLLEANR